MLLPFSVIIAAALRRLRCCGCMTRNIACRLYVNGTQARSPKASMKPKPSCTMSMVVRTASCQLKSGKSMLNGRTVKTLWNCLLLHTAVSELHLIPQSICNIKQLETVHQDHGQGRRTSKLHLFHQHAQVYDHLTEVNVIQQILDYFLNLNKQTKHLEQ